MHTVFTAPQAAAAPSTSSSSGTMASFSGMVTLHPAHPPSLAQATKTASSSGRTVRTS